MSVMPSQPTMVAIAIDVRDVSHFNWPHINVSSWKLAFETLAAESNLRFSTTYGLVSVAGEWQTTATLDRLVSAINDTPVRSLYISVCLPHVSTMSRILSKLQLKMRYELYLEAVPFNLLDAVTKFLKSPRSIGLDFLVFKNSCLQDHDAPSGQLSKLGNILRALFAHTTLTSFCFHNCCRPGERNCWCNDETPLMYTLMRNKVVHRGLQRAATRAMVVARVLALANPAAADKCPLLSLPVELRLKIASFVSLLTAEQTALALVQACKPYPSFPAKATSSIASDPGCANHADCANNPGCAGIRASHIPADHGAWLDAGGFFFRGTAKEADDWAAKQYHLGKIS